MILVPNKKRITVKRAEAYKTTRAGLHLPDVHRGRTGEGTVVGVGGGVKSIHVGDRVLFSNHLAIEVEVDSEPFLIMKEKEVLSRIFEDDEL